MLFSAWPLSFAVAEVAPDQALESQKATAEAAPLQQIAESDAGASKTWNAAEARKAASAVPKKKKSAKASAKSDDAKPMKAKKHKKKKNKKHHHHGKKKK
jgi:hypothetical protein